MSLARCTVLLALVLIVMPGIAAAESVPSPAVLGRELVRILPQGPPGFTLVQADEKPSIKVADYRGFRILLRREDGMPDPNSTQQRWIEGGAGIKTITVRSHIDLVLFPDGQVAPRNLKNRIKWPDVEQRSFVKPVYMGKGHGYYWFGRTTICWQDWVRRKMELTGGDDRAALAIEGLDVRDEGMMTRNSMSGVFRDLGDAAIPSLEAAVKTHENDDPSPYVHQLGYIETDKSTGLLRTLYRSKNPEVSRAAAYILAGYTARPAAKPEYLDMLHRRIRTTSVAQICAKYGWKEAVPDLEAIMASPPSWWDFKAAYLAHRSLTGRPVAETVVQAGERFHYAGKVGEDARSVLAAADDKEAAAVLVIGQYWGRGKMSWEDQEKYDHLALDLLSKLPPEIVRPMVETGARTVTGKYDKERLTKLLGELKGMVDGLWRMGKGECRIG